LKLYVRVLGVDTPEKGGHAKCVEEDILAIQATATTINLVKKAQIITFSHIKWDKFGGRILADVEIDNKSLAEILIAKKVARAYHGEKKASWCPSDGLVTQE
jgi:hypothetical protein